MKSPAPITFSRLFEALLGLFALSGFSALAYEVAWFRLLSLTFGVSVYASSAVLTAFMGGLALGCWLFGRVAARHPAPLRLLALLQLSVGLYALLTPALFGQLTAAYVWAYRQLQPEQGAFVALRIALATLALLPPTILMGGTLPALSRLLPEAGGRGSRELGNLYAVNTLGGVAGALAAGVLLIPLLGASATLYLAGAIDLGVAAAALALSRRIIVADQGPRAGGQGRRANGQPRRADAQVPATAKGRKSGGRVVVQAGSAATLAMVAEAERSEPRPLVRVAPAQVALVGFALSGFTSLGYQVVWTRLLAIFSLNAVYSFTVMLATFLTGLALGSALAAPRAQRARRPLALLGWIQVAVGLCGVAALYLFARMPTLRELLPVRDTFAASVWVEFLTAALVMVVPTLLLGAMFPVAVRVFTESGEGRAADDRPQIADGRPAATLSARVGRLYALNTFGAMLGAAAAGFALIPLLGLQRAALALAIINLAVGTLALLASPTTLSARLQLGGALATAALAAALLPPGVYLGFREGAIPELAYYREGVDATVSVFVVKQPPLKISFVNGRSEVPTDQHSMRAFHLLGHLPALLRPGAQDALMVSFGNGIATGALSSHGVPRIQAVELVAEQVEAARLYGQENRGVLGYPGLTITNEDGRNYLLRDDKTYDIITADATHPINSSSWALFTREFYGLARSRLSPDGVLIQWLPFHDLSQRDYRAIIATFQSVFPHTTLWYTGGTHSFLLATPLPLTRADILALDARLRSGPAGADLGDGQRLAADLLMEEMEVAGYVAGAPIVTDDTAFFIPARDMDRIVASFQPYMQRELP